MSPARRHYSFGQSAARRALTLILLAILLGLALAPVLFPGMEALNVAAKICYFVVLAASYDLLLGYTGIVSFAHTMFFGIGGYGAGIALYNFGPSWSALAARHRRGFSGRGGAGACHRPVFAAGARHLLRHDHARGRERVLGAGLAAE